ncbi:MAG: sigma-70 family RNA polymerase sigma factor [Planctomycetes bacterium]|nr:sigma-70 family RNA polymerase sigma factor [Planctomycetota bacterium]
MSEPRSDDFPSDHPFAALYDRLHAAAARLMAGERQSHTLQPTALVHETFLRLDRAPGLEAANLFAVAVRAMRQVLIDHARVANAQKRRAPGIRVTTDCVCEDSRVAVIELDDVIRRLERLDERKARVVELRVFGTLTVPEIARQLGVAESTVNADWRTARAWLARELDIGKN